MTCYHPYKSFVVGINPETDKKILKITKYDVSYIYIDKFGKYKYKFNPDICPDVLNCDEAKKKYCQLDCYPTEVFEENFYRWHPKLETPIFEFFTIPCGQCLGCRIKTSRDWANRMMLEMPYASSAWFLTLTYDDDHIPVSEMLDSETGEIVEHATLDKKELQKFIKRLRKKFGDGIRYYAVGEYGSKTMRPHYHAIIWNLPLEDLREDPLRCRSQKGYKILVSDALASCWTVADREDPLYGTSKGLHAISEVNWHTCAYVARYVTKKLRGPAAQKYIDLGIEPEFSIMSRRPGIGHMWYDEHGEDAYETDIIRLSGIDGPLEFMPPTYYDRLFEELHLHELEEVKSNRRTKAVNATRLKLTQTDKTYPEFLATQEYNFKHRIRSLDRREPE